MPGKSRKPVSDGLDTSKTMRIFPAHQQLVLGAFLDAVEEPIKKIENEVLKIHKMQEGKLV